MKTLYSVAIFALMWVGLDSLADTLDHQSTPSSKSGQLMATNFNPSPNFKPVQPHPIPIFNPKRMPVSNAVKANPHPFKPIANGVKAGGGSSAI